MEAVVSPDAAHGSIVGVAGLVLLGSVIPVVPTGPVLAVGVALAGSRSIVLVPITIAIAAAAAWVGDTITFAALRFGGPKLVGWIERRTDSGVVQRFAERLHQRGGTFLVVSRLVPAGRIPCLLVAGATGFPWRRFLPFQAVGAVLWACAYGALGLVGGGLFSDPYVATGLTLGLTVLVLLGQYAWTRAHRPPA